MWGLVKRKLKTVEKLAVLIWLEQKKLPDCEVVAGVTRPLQPNRFKLNFKVSWQLRHVNGFGMRVISTRTVAVEASSFKS